MLRLEKNTNQYSLNFFLEIRYKVCDNEVGMKGERAATIKIVLHILFSFVLVKKTKS